MPVVLLVSLVVIITAVTINTRLRLRLDIARGIQAHSRSRLLARSTLNEVIFNLMTGIYTSTGVRFSNQNGVQTVWNLYNEPISPAPEIEIRLQDCAGLLSPLFPSAALERLAASRAKAGSLVPHLRELLQDWQDSDDLKHLQGAEAFDYRMAGYPYTPRNFFLQTLDEIELLKGFPPDLYPRLRPDLVYWPARHINCMTMSPELLEAWFGNRELAARLVSLRRSGRLTPTMFSALTGISSDFRISFAPSSRIRVTIRTVVQKAVDKLTVVIVKKDSNKRPFLLTSWQE